MFRHAEKLHFSGNAVFYNKDPVLTLRMLHLLAFIFHVDALHANKRFLMSTRFCRLFMLTATTFDVLVSQES